MTWEEIEQKVKVESRGEFVCINPQLDKYYYIGAMRLNSELPLYYFSVSHGEKWHEAVSFYVEGVAVIIKNMTHLEGDADLWIWRNI